MRAVLPAPGTPIHRSCRDEATVSGGRSFLPGRNLGRNCGFDSKYLIQLMACFLVVPHAGLRTVDRNLETFPKDLRKHRTQQKIRLEIVLSYQPPI